MKISVISPCRNELAHVDDFLRSVLAQRCGGHALEIIVADGMSDDGTQQRLAQWAQRDARIRVIPNPGRIVSTGLNRATAAATGEIVVRMDMHTTYASDYVAQCVAALQATGAQCVGGPWVAQGKTPCQKAIACAFQSSFGSGAAASRRKDYSGPADTVYLGAWWKRDLERYGGFDEALVRNQDDELCLRIRRAGGTVWQSAAIRSCYTPRDSIAALFRQYRQYGYWKVLVMKKHRLPASIRHVAPAGFIAWLCVLALLAPFHPAAAAVLAATIGAYAAAACASAVRTGNTDRHAVPLVMAAFAAMHFGYGLGFGRGLVDFFLAGGATRSSMESLTR